MSWRMKLGKNNFMETTPQALSSGFHYITAAQYHADPCASPSLSSSIAKILIEKSPLHAYCEHPQLGGTFTDDSTDEMDFGSLAHKLLLGSGADIATFEGETWRGKDASAFWDEAKAAGYIPCLLKNRLRAQEMTKGVRLQMATMGLDYVFSEQGDGISEVVVIWQEGETWCRAMIDRMIERNGMIELWDFKSMSQSAHPKACASRIASMGYDLQRAHYIQGVQMLRPEMAGRILWRFAFAETARPFAVTPIQLHGEWATIGVSKWCRALALWQECLKSGKWPTYTDKLLTAEAPPWALAQEIGA